MTDWRTTDVKPKKIIPTAIVWLVSRQPSLKIISLVIRKLYIMHEEIISTTNELDESYLPSMIYVHSGGRRRWKGGMRGIT